MAILRVQDVEVRMGSQQILRGVSWRCRTRGGRRHRRQRCRQDLADARDLRHLPLRGGHIAFAGTPIANLKSHRIVRLGLVQAPEGRMIFGAMSVRENLVLGALSEPASEVAAAFRPRAVDVSRPCQRLRQKAGSLSGGEQQMLCIGRALMGNPSCCCSTSLRSDWRRWWCS